MFSRAGIRPWELGRLTIEQLHQGRYTFDAEIKAAQESNQS